MKKIYYQLIIVDTNVLFMPEKTHVVSTEFEAIWKQYKDQHGFKLILPETVYGELLFQHTSTALKKLNRINQQLNELSLIAGKKYPHKLSENRVKCDVQERLDAWLKENDASVEATPIKHINWEQLIQAAIWRNPPFETDDDAKNKKEKGFRDALILETLIYICEKEHSRININFICRDGILYKEAVRKLSIYPRFKHFETFNDLISKLSLMREKYNELAAEGILATANNKFYNEKSFEQSLIKQAILKIFKLYKFELENPPFEQNRSCIASFFSLFRPAHDFKSYKDYKFFVTNANFLSADGIKFYWSNLVFMFKPFKRNDRYFVHLLEFEVFWESCIKKDKEFKLCKINKIGLLRNQSAWPTTAVDQIDYGIEGLIRS